MTDREARKAAQKAKIAAMPLGTRIAVVLGGAVAAVVVAVVVAVVLGGEPNLGTAIAIGTGMLAVFGYQYLVEPARQNDADGSS